ncbi:MAG TPA: lipoyl synthase [Bacteroidales bacterium]|nr:lipoyl synthase [Bacteroidales bacterium]
MKEQGKYLRKPEWLKIRLPRGEEFAKVNGLVKKYHLNTICTSGNCPNHADCWERGTATLMILGDICTRACKFCNVTTGKPLPLDWSEPFKVAQTVKELNLKHCVLTSVDRDDLPDGGAEVWAETIRQIKKLNPSTTIETLIPDFDGNMAHIHKIIDARPEVISHNLETVRRLTPMIRSRAKYDTSLKVLQYIAQSGLTAKSGIMLGLGEEEVEIYETMDDLLAVGCKVFTIGQYLQPTRNNFPVQAYVTPEKFEMYGRIGLEKGFRFIESAPLVRSSFHAERHAPPRINAGNLKI